MAFNTRDFLEDVVPKVVLALLLCRRFRHFSFNPCRATDNTTSLVSLRRPLYMRHLRFFLLCGCPRRCSTFGALGFNMHRKGQPDYRLHTGVRLRIGGAALAALILHEKVGCSVNLEGYRKTNS